MAVAGGRTRFLRWTAPLLTPIVAAMVVVARALPGSLQHVVEGWCWEQLGEEALLLRTGLM